MEPELSLVVPTYNERGNIAPLIDQLRAALGALAYEIIVVDDASPDGTGSAVQSLADEDPRLRLIERKGERGLSGAVIHGFKAARGSILAVIDADLSHDPALLPSLVAAVKGGAEIAVGSRRVAGGGADKWPWHRRFTSDAATYLAKFLLHVPIEDVMSGYFVLRRDVYDRVRGRLQPEGYKILLEILVRARPMKVVELPYVFKDRHQGVSKLTPGVAAQYLRLIWRLSRDKGFLKGERTEGFANKG